VRKRGYVLEAPTEQARGFVLANRLSHRGCGMTPNSRKLGVEPQNTARARSIGTGLVCREQECVGEQIHVHRIGREKSVNDVVVVGVASRSTNVEPSAAVPV
jgi:hypothetical protein